MVAQQIMKLINVRVLKVWQEKRKVSKGGGTSQHIFLFETLKTRDG